MNNTEIMMKFIGVSGGTIHQVAKACGVSAENILNPVKIDTVEELEGFALWNEPSKQVRVRYVSMKKEPEKTISSIINAYKVGIYNKD